MRPDLGRDAYYYDQRTPRSEASAQHSECAYGNRNSDPQLSVTGSSAAQQGFVPGSAPPLGRLSQALTYPRCHLKEG